MKESNVAKGRNYMPNPALVIGTAANREFLDSVMIMNHPPFNMESIVKAIKGCLDASEVFVFTVDDQTGTLRRARSDQGYSADNEMGGAWSGSEQKAWMKLISRTRLVVDVPNDPVVAEVREQLLKQEARSVLILPLLLAGELVGGVAIIHRYHYEWGKEELVSAVALVWQVAMLVHLCRMEVELGRARHAREELLARASHDLRTPLTSIVAYAQYLEHYMMNGLGDKEFELRLVKVIRAQAACLTGVVQDVLDIKTMSGDELRLKKEPLDLGELLHEVVEEVRLINSDNPIEINLPKLPMVVADRRRLQQVIVKLLNNAIAYSPGGGSVILSMQIKAGKVLTSVEDHGVGIKEYQRRFVFDRFFEGDDDPRLGNGAGLGNRLYISRAIIEAHGGQLWVESREGKGSTFWFTLPLEASNGDNNGE